MVGISPWGKAPANTGRNPLVPQRCHLFLPLCCCQGPKATSTVSGLLRPPPMGGLLGCSSSHPARCQQRALSNLEPPSSLPGFQGRRPIGQSRPPPPGLLGPSRLPLAACGLSSRPSLLLTPLDCFPDVLLALRSLSCYSPCPTLCTYYLPSKSLLNVEPRVGPVGPHSICTVPGSYELPAKQSLD